MLLSVGSKRVKHNFMTEKQQMAMYILPIFNWVIYPFDVKFPRERERERLGKRSIFTVPKVFTMTVRSGMCTCSSRLKFEVQKQFCKIVFLSSSISISHRLFCSLQFLFMVI